MFSKYTDRHGFCFQVMSNQEAVDSIRQIKDAQAAAKHLIEEAVSKKSKDDISCIVVRFQWHAYGLVEHIFSQTKKTPVEHLES